MSKQPTKWDKIGAVFVLIAVILLIFYVFYGCSKFEDSGLLVKQGENIFHPNRPTAPFIGKTYKATIQIGPEWFEGDLTDPVGWGCKLHAIGKWNYHEGGCNFAISESDGRCFVSARYYEPIDSGTYKLHEGIARREIFADTPVHLQITFQDSTRFYVDGDLIATIMPLPHGFICPPFLGRSGHDNNYPGGPIPGAFAARNLRLFIGN